MAADLKSVLDRVARAMESVVPELVLTVEVEDQEWFEETEEDSGEWVKRLGFEMHYRGDWLGSFAHMTTGSEPEQVRAVTLQLMSVVQDIVSEATTEPWPLVIVSGRRDLAMAGAAIEADDLHLWYGDRDAPALKLPSVSLV